MIPRTILHSAVCPKGRIDPFPADIDLSFEVIPLRLIQCETLCSDILWLRYRLLKSEPGG